MATKVVQYTLADFERIRRQGFSFALKPETLQVIQSIADEVGSPEYVRTPKFDKSVEHAPRHPTSDTHGRRKPKVNEISDEDWENVRNFQATVMAKKQGAEGSIESIRQHLNKLTPKTYEHLKEQIIDEIDQLIRQGKKTNILPPQLLKDLEKLGEVFFTIASSNSFYSNVYANLFKELMDKYDFMQRVFDRNFEVVRELFNDFQTCDPEKDYDKFCDINKQNERRRALGLFYVNLTKHDVIGVDDMSTIILELQDKLQTFIAEAGKKAIVEELAEIIYILVTNGSEVLSYADEYWQQIKTQVERVTTINAKTTPSATNKTIFKHLDLLEHMQKV